MVLPASPASWNASPSTVAPSRARNAAAKSVRVGLKRVARRGPDVGRASWRSAMTTTSAVQDSFARRLPTDSRGNRLGSARLRWFSDEPMTIFEMVPESAYWAIWRARSPP